MREKLTTEQVERMAKLAILASKPVGLGIMHYSPNLKESDILLLDSAQDGDIYVDYYQGRMVKFHATRDSEGFWEFSDTISEDYQSWKEKYSGYAELILAVL